MVPLMDSMGHTLSIDYFGAPNELLNMDLFPLDVNLCQTFLLTVLAATFLYELYFTNNLTHWRALPPEFFYLIYKYRVHLFSLCSRGFLLAKNIV
jgi:hypothetical protein